MMVEPDEYAAHVIVGDGITATPFRRTSDTTWANAEAITLKPGAVLDGGTWHIANPVDPPTFTFTPLLEFDDGKEEDQ